MEISRIIFPRKMRPKDMAVVAQACAKRSPGLENMKYEAFALNELCQFPGDSAIPCTVTRWDICAVCRIGPV